MTCTTTGKFLANVKLIGRAMRGSVLAPTPLPPHSKNETIRRGRRPAQRMAANKQVKVSGGTRARKKKQAYSQGGGREAPHVDQHAHEEQRGRHFTPRTIYSDSTGALSLHHLESDPLAESIHKTHQDKQTQRCLSGVTMGSHQRCDCLDNRMATVGCLFRSQAGRLLTQQLFTCAHYTRLVKHNAMHRLLQQPHGQCGEQKWGDRLQAKGKCTYGANWGSSVTG